MSPRLGLCFGGETQPDQAVGPRGSLRKQTLQTGFGDQISHWQKAAEALWVVIRGLVISQDTREHPHHQDVPVGGWGKAQEERGVLGYMKRPHRSMEPVVIVRIVGLLTALKSLLKKQMAGLPANYQLVVCSEDQSLRGGRGDGSAAADRWGWCSDPRLLLWGCKGTGCISAVSFARVGAFLRKGGDSGLG